MSEILDLPLAPSLDSFVYSFMYLYFLELPLWLVPVLVTDMQSTGLLWWPVVKTPCSQCRGHGFDP